MIFNLYIKNKKEHWGGVVIGGSDLMGGVWCRQSWLHTSVWLWRCPAL